MRCSALLAVAALACGPGIQDQGLGALPVASVAGHVERASLTRVEPGAPLRGALVWTAVPPVNEPCLMDPAVMGPTGACLDPYGVYAAYAQGTTELDADGNFTLELFELPPAGVMVGDASGHIAYGTLVVFEDVDRNDSLSIPMVQGFGGRFGGGGPGGPDIGPGIIEFGDHVLAASFGRQFTDHERVVFREGGFDGESWFYRSCGEPPLGFSTLSDATYVDPAEALACYAGTGSCPDVRCTFDDVSRRLELRAFANDEAKTFECGASAGAFYSPPGFRDDDSPFQPEPDAFCISDPSILVSVHDAVTCKATSVIALRGCFDTLRCEPPDWDEPMPEGWPCR
jgi:hypothetical protein